jgi:hypothetical protein
MDAKHLSAEALRLSDDERAALAGELIQSLDREIDADAEAAWSKEIRARRDRVDAGTATTIPMVRGQASHPRQPVVVRDLHNLGEALEEAVAAARWYAERARRRPRISARSTSCGGSGSRPRRALR